MEKYIAVIKYRTLQTEKYFETKEEAFKYINDLKEYHAPYYEGEKIDYDIFEIVYNKIEENEKVG